MLDTQRKIAICVAGWHYNRDLYAELHTLPQAQVFVVSHKPPRQVPSWLFDYVKREQVFFEPNLGYDWGCYQQFLIKGIWREFEYIFFMHDDLVIKNPGFIERCIELLDSGKKFVSNGQNSVKTDWPMTHCAVYAHSRWKPPSRHFRHDTMRGSFFATARQVLEQLDAFEVLWDWLHLNIRYGNHSLLATCGKIQAMFGDNSFGFLSDTYLESEYILEMQRGGQELHVADRPGRARQLSATAYVTLASFYMRVYLRPGMKWLRTLISILIGPLIYIMAGRGLRCKA